MVLDYRPPLEDRPLTRLTTWLVTPLSPWWRTAMVASSCLVLWGAAWLPGATLVEWLGWIGLSICATYGLLRRPLRWIVRRLHGLPSLRNVASERYAWWQLLLLVAAVSSPIYWWPLRLSLLVQRPFIERFGDYVYAEAPMLYPPATPRMAGLFIITDARADPGGATVRVWGSHGTMTYVPDGAAAPYWLNPARMPWYLRWALPPASGHWAINSRRSAEWLRWLM